MNIDLFKTAQTVTASGRYKRKRIIAFVFIPLAFLIIYTFVFIKYYSANFSFILQSVIIFTGWPLVAGYLYLNMIKTRFEFYTDKIINCGLRRESVLYYSEIKGYRKVKDNEVINLVPIAEDKDSIMLEREFFAGRTDILNWIEGKFKDLDKEEAENKLNEVMSNQDCGGSAEQRSTLLKKTKIAAIGINIASAIILVWAGFSSTGDISLFSIILQPPLALLLIRFSKGLLTYLPTKEKIIPHIAVPVFFPGFVIALKSMLYWNSFVKLGDILPYTLLVLILITGYAFIINPELRSNKSLWALYFVVFLFYSAGSVVMVNCIYLKEGVRYFKVKLEDKKIFQEKNTQLYKIRLSPWELESDVTYWRIEKELYNKYSPGDSVIMIVKKGFLNINLCNIE